MGPSQLGAPKGMRDKDYSDNKAPNHILGFLKRLFILFIFIPVMIVTLIQLIYLILRWMITGEDVLNEEPLIIKIFNL